MASLVYSIHSPEPQGRLMEACEARPRPSLLGQSGSFSSCLLGTERFLMPYMRHQASLEKVFRITPRIRIRNYLSKLPSMCKIKGSSFPPCQELCKVLWTVEADLADGQLLYITGDLISLGRWQPEMAVLMSPSEQPNLWKTEVKVPYGVTFKYNYFVKGDKWPSYELVWRDGPEFSLSVPPPSKHNGQIMVRDSWMVAQTKNPPVHSWGSWMEETNLPEQFSSTTCTDEDKILTSPKSYLAGSMSFFNDLTDKENITSNMDLDSSKTFFERDQPVEEPWLLQSSLFFLENNTKMDPDVLTGEADQDQLAHVGFPNEHHESTENLLPEEGSKLTCTEDSICTVILINSSICTMQRIAVLEDGKLVELLLEPVKNNVQCDSAYLGVITKLVPHMGGAFVNIGIPRPSLMDIKHNREPFVFPPFRSKTKQKIVNGSVISKLQEGPDVHGDEPVSLGDVDVIDDVAVDFQDDSIQFLHDDFEEHEIEDDFDVPDGLEESVDGSVVDNIGVDGNFGNYVDGNTHHPQGDNVKQFPPVEVEGQNDSQLSQKFMRDLGDSLTNEKKWAYVRKSTKVIVQVVKEGLGTKGPTLTAYPNLRSRFWILSTSCDRIGVSKKISGVERTRLRVIAKTLQPPGFGLTVRTVAAGHSLEELQKDLERLLYTWKDIMEHAKSAALAADEGIEGAVPVILHRAMGQTLSFVQDYFNEKVKSMVVDSPRTYHEVTSYLQEIAPSLCDRVELYDKRIPIFDEYGIEEEINNILSKRVPLANGGSLVIEQTEALVSIDVNGGHGMLGQRTSQEKAILDVNLLAAKQIARELRLRDIGGIIVVDFIDMADDSNKRLVYEEVKKAVERDRSMVKVSELSRHGLMEITRKRVRPSVTFMISEPCTCCHATGRVEALETSFSKIEHEICRWLAMSDRKADPENPKSWPRFVLRVDRYMCNYLTSGKRTRLAILSSSLKAWILLKVARGFARGAFEVEPYTDEEKSNKHQVAISRLRPTEARTCKQSTKLTLFPVKKWKAGAK